MIRLPRLERFLALQEGALARAAGDQRISLTQRGRPASQPTAIERKLAWWARRQAAGATRYRAEQDLVRPDWRRIRADLEGLLAAVGLAVVEQMDHHLGQQALDAQAAWPMDTGLSRVLLFFGIEAHERYIQGSLGCGAPYTPYIRQRKTQSERRRAYLRQQPDGSWTFDEAAYTAGESGRKRAKGKPYADLITRPARRTAQAIGRDAIAQAAQEAPR